MGGGGELEPSKLALPHPWYCAWMIQNFINVLTFRVRPGMCYDEEAEEYIKQVPLTS